MVMGQSLEKQLQPHPQDNADDISAQRSREVLFALFTHLQRGEVDKVKEMDVREVVIALLILHNLRHAFIVKNDKDIPLIALLDYYRTERSLKAESQTPGRWEFLLVGFLIEAGFEESQILHAIRSLGWEDYEKEFFNGVAERCDMIQLFFPEEEVFDVLYTN
jgi:hypothetical protein